MRLSIAIILSVVCRLDQIPRQDLFLVIDYGDQVKNLPINVDPSLIDKNHSRRLRGSLELDERLRPIHGFEDRFKNPDNVESE